MASEIIPLSHVSEVLNVALTEKPKPIEWDPTSMIGSSAESNNSEDGIRR